MKQNPDKSDFSDAQMLADLIRVGAYTKGTAPQVDRAIDLLPAVELFLKQNIGEYCPFGETCEAMKRIAAAWRF